MNLGIAIHDVVSLRDGARVGGIVIGYDARGWPLVAWPDDEIASVPHPPEALVVLFPAEDEYDERL